METETPLCAQDAIDTIDKLKSGYAIDIANEKQRTNFYRRALSTVPLLMNAVGEDNLDVLSEVLGAMYEAGTEEGCGCRDCPTT